MREICEDLSEYKVTFVRFNPDPYIDAAQNVIDPPMDERCAKLMRLLHFAFGLRDRLMTQTLYMFYDAPSQN
jgi:hypothetical protein